MIRLVQIELSGKADVGAFRGELTLSPGIQIISAHNSYGKSLAVTAVAWCLGLEPMLGFPDNDATCFPEAARERIELGERSDARVLSSACSITIAHQDGRQLRLERDIKGDPTVVSIEETSADGEVRHSRLVARRETMHDEHGGLQRFLFGWLGWQRESLLTYKGTSAEIYLENVAPLFYIEQDEGWTGVQALQITRYGQQQIAEIAIEYLLGATEAIKARVARLQMATREMALRENARAIAERVTTLFLRNGWAVEWSGNGSITEILARWTRRSLRESLRKQAEVDLASQRQFLEQQAETLRKKLTSEPIDPANASAPAGASQKAIELKMRRHALSAELRALYSQQAETEILLESLSHRIHTATDLHRLKTTGIGRLDHLECPVCHRDLDPDTFGLTVQSADSVAAHIESLKRDRDLVRKNNEGSVAAASATRAELERISDELREAERALMTVTAAVGTIREQVAQTAADLGAVERSHDRLSTVIQEIEGLQGEIDRWVAAAQTVARVPIAASDLQHRRQAFLDALRKYLLALGHSAMHATNLGGLTLDEQYTPFLEGRLLRSLGSASDRARYVAAYSLALAAASNQVQGLHPGIVLLDEPLQQNPDPAHRELFLTFLEQELARQATFQTVIFTSLWDYEIAALREKGTRVISPEGRHFLNLEPPPAETPSDEGSATDAGSLDPTKPETDEGPSTV